MSEELATAARNNAAGSHDSTTVTTLVYALQAVGLLIGITWFAGVIINYVKRDDMAGSWQASHFRWQIRTFWFSLLWSFLGMLTSVLLIGYFVLIANALWTIYRVVKGWLFLTEGKEMYR